MENLPSIKVRKAGEHNLKDIDIDIPRDKLVVITGLSGSGKSSLAFDTIYAEGQRRYVESLSAYARQFLDQMQKPEVESIEGLTPTIAIEQRSGKATPRSTVATSTEIYDYLRVLYARGGLPHCPICQSPIESQSAEDIVRLILAEKEGTRIQLLAPMVRGRKGEHRDIFEHIQKEGFSRVRVDGEIHDIESPPVLKKNFKHTIEAVVDRIILKESSKSRLTDSVEVALKLSDGFTGVILTDKDTGKESEMLFSEKFACPEHGPVLEEMSPRAFSFNSPFGACPTCSGLGTLMEPDPELVIPNKELSLEAGALTAWKRCGSGMRSFYPNSVRWLARHYGISVSQSWKAISEDIRQQILFGSSKAKGDLATYEGVIPNLMRRFKTTESEGQKTRIHEFMASHPCPDCQGKRLKPEILSVTIADKNIHHIAEMTIEKAHDFFTHLQLDPEKQKIAEPVKKAVLERLGFLLNVGLGYLTLDRATNTLSGGEAQRIRLASQVGAKLVGVTYVLDEPTIGLHQKDNDRLLETLVQLKEIGNTVIVVEHDEDVINRADHLIDIGPGAGEHGGQVVEQGTPEEIRKHGKSITADYLAGRRFIPLPEKRRKSKKKEHITLKGAEENNLKKVSADFPLGMLICVTGVSGSGKSTLVNECLYKGLQKSLGNQKILPGKFKSIQGVEKIDKIINIDQSPIGRTPRSNPATYTGVFDGIRKLFAMTPEAKSRGYTPGRFSFNVKGGRCESCQGQGVKTIEMHFLPNVFVPCETCKGSRYNAETLQVKYKGKTIAEVLNMPVEEAADFFQNHVKIYPGLKTLNDVGLGYIRLGQPSTTLSGGEAQRIKLASELSRKSTGQTFYILDEPTTGLHFYDVSRLLEVLQILVDMGNTVVVIEHNLDIIKSADWIIDMGPEGGDKGGTIVAQGSPEDITKVKESYTGDYLRDRLTVTD